jgi:hypothetical protein
VRFQVTAVNRADFPGEYTTVTLAAGARKGRHTADHGWFSLNKIARIVRVGGFCRYNGAFSFPQEPKEFAYETEWPLH